MSTITIKVGSVTITIVSDETPKVSTVPEKPERIALVDNSELNQDNPFWAELIGTKVKILAEEPDGLLVVEIPGNPIPAHGVEPQRVIETK